MRTPSWWLGRARARWLGYPAALGAVALVSAGIGLVLGRAHVANISMLYLLAVFAAAMGFGSGPAILAAVAAFVVFDWFFVPPLHAFTIADPEEWIALLFFLATALITGQLTAAVRRRALQAAEREREASLLYDAARLLGDDELGRALPTLAARLREALGLAAVVIDLADGASPAVHAAAGEPDAVSLAERAGRLPRRVLHGGAAPTAGRRAAAGEWVRVVPSRPPGAGGPGAADRVRQAPVRAGARRLGVLTLMQRPDAGPPRPEETRLVSAVAAQLGLAVERARLRREATEAEVLRRTDELKTALLNAVSHDLRTPLASIIASAGSLRQRDVPWTEAERQEFAEAIEEEALRLNRLVGNLLDLSRIEAGSLRPERGWYDLGALIDDVLGRLRPRLAAHPVAVRVPTDLPPVPLDYVEIDQVLSNLLENAAKYTPPGTPIAVTARRDAETLEVAVEDRGPGVPGVALPRLFERFYRVDGAGPRPQGIGVGLAVAKGLVEAHGGAIRAENRPGGGARFVFTLPLATEHPAVAAPEGVASPETATTERPR